MPEKSSSKQQAAIPGNAKTDELNGSELISAVNDNNHKKSKADPKLKKTVVKKDIKKNTSSSKAKAKPEVKAAAPKKAKKESAVKEKGRRVNGRPSSFFVDRS